MDTKPSNAGEAKQSPKEAKRKRGRPGIVDAFSNLEVSRQRKWQLRQMSKGGCRICGEMAISKGYCLKHLVRERDYSANRFGYKRENQNCKSRLLQKLIDKPQNHWKYEVVSARAHEVNGNLAAQDTLIKKWGELGWELTAAIPQADGDTWFYFKQPISLAEELGMDSAARKVQAGAEAESPAPSTTPSLKAPPLKVSFAADQATQSGNVDNDVAGSESERDDELSDGHIVGV